MPLHEFAKGALRDQDLTALPSRSLKSGEFTPTHEIADVLIPTPEYSRRFGAQQQIRLVLENGIQMLMHMLRHTLKIQASGLFLNSPPSEEDSDRRESPSG
jgi:hypothetical protein